MSKQDRQELDRLKRMALMQGWRITQGKTGHVTFWPSDTRQPPVVAGSTPSDHRAWENVKARLRRAGLKGV